jgi:hypothetical protein
MTKSPSEVLTDALRGCCNGYVGAPALALQCASALRAAGWIIVREGSIGAAQREAVAAYREDNDNVRSAA